MAGTVPFIQAHDIDSHLQWTALVAALTAGHKQPRAEIADTLLRQSGNAFLNRAGWVKGIGPGIKTVTVFPGNPSAEHPCPTVQGMFLLFDETTGAPKAIIDGALITKWKTAADSVLGAKILAKSNSRNIVIMGTGALARGLVNAYSALFPEMERILVWSRVPENAEKFVKEYACKGLSVAVVENIAEDISAADIVATATAAITPILHGEWVAPGTHVDLAGAYLPETREADDALLQRARIFVDSRETTLDHIGELKIPIAAKVISSSDILGDLYDLVAGVIGRQSPDDITVYKNGGGAHLDLMTAAYIHDTWSAISAN